MIILYGSQGGTSKSVALLLQNILDLGYSEEYISELNLENKKTSIIEMDKFNFNQIFDLNCIIFICSTQGTGSEPFNMTRFWNILKKIKIPNFLSHLNFAVFGLGDSSYNTYNYCSKKLFNLLKRLGAKPLIRRGCGDDQDKEGWLTDFKPWCKELIDNEIIKKEMLEDINIYNTKIDSHFYVKTLKSSYLTPSDYKPANIELELMIYDLESFKPGDCLAISPNNYNLKDFMDYNEINDSRLEDSDFNSVPQIMFFSYLHQLLLQNKTFVDRSIIDKVYELYNDYSFYYDFIRQPRRTIFETIKELGIKLPLNFILQYIPSITPRYFTLTKRDDKYYILVSIVAYKTILKEERRGLCSEYLKSDLARIKCTLGKSLLEINKEKILIICTGAGISIANSMIHFYNNKEFVVYYGFRYWNKDCHSKDILNKKNVTVHHASSRDDGLYVQDVYEKNPIIDIQNYDIVISGNSRLNKIVEGMFKKIYNEKIFFYSETW
ncbi:NADPH-dependent diflavin oxidoreductase 1 [Nosema bombycis CQ1]|uniref:NADPH-dependent diflavin oxidoreductase 1 n=1 Tax=Nosema bombycis (strain CQ1 / CVCC 102059) TaxID=578461 RepID=R0KQL4_NOSB1|nr:NADPH-dependent diflavin oxidoreductase 1 [Nosema bombycis CQ1]|eukprot:EOB12497.1 NADPH-dependent diflavin oxidoreductase 1 [Nosema bombycis CQ1]